MVEFKTIAKTNKRGRKFIKLWIAIVRKCTCARDITIKCSAHIQRINYVKNSLISTTTLISQLITTCRGPQGDCSKVITNPVTHICRRYETWRIDYGRYGSRIIWKKINRKQKIVVCIPNTDKGWLIKRWNPVKTVPIHS